MIKSRESSKSVSKSSTNLADQPPKNDPPTLDQQELDQFKKCEKILKPHNNLPLSSQIEKQYNAIFELRNLKKESLKLKAIKLLYQTVYSSQFKLIKVEATYSIGQMRHKGCFKPLLEILSNTSVPSFVRQRAAEGLIVLSDAKKSILSEVFSKYLLDPSESVSDFCMVGLMKLFHDINSNMNKNANIYSHDIVPPYISESSQTLQSRLMSSQTSLMSKFRSVFTLRDLNDGCSEEILILALDSDYKHIIQGVLRQEIVYSLGVMQSHCAIDCLRNILLDRSEPETIRSEAALSLGSINLEHNFVFLEQFISDCQQIVRESVIIALSSSEYL